MTGADGPRSYTPPCRAAPMPKYLLAYILVGLLVALGVYVVGRPDRRFDPDNP